MKTKLFALIFSFAALNNAYACYSNSDLTICPGNKAVMDSYPGKVIGVNPRTGKVSMQLDSGYIRTYNATDITVGKGCFKDACVGKTATMDSYPGKIIGVNAITEKVSIRLDSGYVRTYTYKDITIGNLCLKGLCTGDSAVMDSYPGVITGVNRSTGKVTLRLDSGYVRTYGMKSITVGKGCLEGVCVGDKAVMDSYAGTIIGIGPFTRKVSMRLNSGYIRTYNLNDITVSSYCLDYDMNHEARNVSNEIDFELTFKVSVKIK